MAVNSALFLTLDPYIHPGRAGQVTEGEGHARDCRAVQCSRWWMSFTSAKNCSKDGKQQPQTAPLAPPNLTAAAAHPWQLLIPIWEQSLALSFQFLLFWSSQRLVFTTEAVTEGSLLLRSADWTQVIKVKHLLKRWYELALPLESVGQELWVMLQCSCPHQLLREHSWQTAGRFIVISVQLCTQVPTAHLYCVIWK